MTLALIIFVSLYIIWKVIPRAVDKVLEREIKPWITEQIIESESRVRALLDAHKISDNKVHTGIITEVNTIYDALAKYPPAINKIWDAIDAISSDDPIPMPANAVIKAEAQEKYTAPKATEMVSPNLKPVHSGLPLIGHTLLVGQNGSGKSNVLMSAVIERWQKKHTLYLVDTKQELAQLFEQIVPSQNIIEDLRDVPKLVQTLLNAGQVRRDMFNTEARKRKEPIRDHIEYEEVTGQRLPIITLFIEELVVVAETLGPELFTKMFVMLRSAGIFIFAVSQRLKTTILPSEASTNIVNKVYLGAPDKYQFGSMFPEGLPDHISREAKQLLGPPGMALLYTNNEYEFKQMPRIDRELLKELMQ